MRIYIFVLISCFYINDAVKAQVINTNSVKPDSIVETIVYEYDTVYVAPDTLKLTDTIVNYLRIPEKIKKHNLSVGFSILPFISNPFNQVNAIDSFSNQKVFNYSLDVNIGYTLKNYIVSIGAGITPIHERLRYQSSHNVSTSSQVASASYDSLQVNYNCTADNYYDYFNAYLSIGRKWRSKNFDYGCNISLITDILIDFKAFVPVSPPLENRIHSTSVRQLGFSAAVSPYLGYRFGKKLELFVAPFYKYTFNKDHRYPQNNLQNLGIGVGFNIIL